MWRHSVVKLTKHDFEFEIENEVRERTLTLLISPVVWCGVDLHKAGCREVQGLDIELLLTRKER